MKRILMCILISLLGSGPIYAFTDSLWIVGDWGYSDSLVIVEVWLQYEGAGGDDMFADFTIPLTWDATVCTADAVTIGPDFRSENWMNVSRIDNQGTMGPPAVPKMCVASFLPGPVGSPGTRGTHLAATVDFRILNTASALDSACFDTLMSGFTPPVELGFCDEHGLVRYVPSFSTDCIRVIPSNCGDCNVDGRVTIADATYIVGYIYRNQPGGPCMETSADVNLDRRITIADATYIAGYTLRDGPEPCNPP